MPRHCLFCDLHSCSPAPFRVWPDRVVIVLPFGQFGPCVGQRGKQWLVQALIAQLAVEAGHERILGWLPAYAQTVHGAARAVDGDTLEVSGKRVRLYGIDTREPDQTCEKDGASWACDQTTTQQVSELVVGQVVVCSVTSVDPYGRMLAVCGCA